MINFKYFLMLFAVVFLSPSFVFWALCSFGHAEIQSINPFDWSGFPRVLLGVWFIIALGLSVGFIYGDDDVNGESE